MGKTGMTGRLTVGLNKKDYVLGHAEYRMINKKLHKKKLSAGPHRDILDLAAVYMVVVDCGKHGITCQITEEMMEELGITLEELDAAARANTEKVGFTTKTLKEAVEGLYQDYPVPTAAGRIRCGCEDIYVVTNERKAYGANAILYKDTVIKQLAETEGDDLFIIPSSIHELLATRALWGCEDYLKGTLKEVNSTLKKSEILGYQLYRYSRDTGEIRIEK